MGYAEYYSDRSKYKFLYFRRNPYCMHLLKQHPFIRICIAWIIGIYLGDLNLCSLMMTQITFAGILMLILSFNLLHIKIAFRFRQLVGWMIWLLMIVGGMITIQEKDIRHNADWVGHDDKKTTAYWVAVTESTVQRKKTKRVVVKLRKVHIDGKWIEATGNLLLYLQSSNKSESLEIGTNIICFQKIRLLKDDTLFAEGYKDYLARRGIYHAAYVRSKDYLIFTNNHQTSIQNLIQQLQKKTIGLLRGSIHDSSSCALAEALLIGYRNDMDKSQVKIYTDAGIVHIIAISGMHLGVMFISLSWILEFIPFLRQRNWIKAVLILLFLWTFTLLCGASPSVLRSAVMYTFIIIGKAMKRDNMLHNMLAVSAFVLLCYNPYLLWDIGFQLSYLAIIGIVWLQKPIYRLIKNKNRLFEKIWEMMAITIAAQITTLPICLFYFHQFPNYFLPSNLLAVPLSTVILFMEIGIIALAPIHYLYDCIGWATEKLLLLFENSMLFFSRLPGAVTRDIYADIWTTILLFGMIVLLGWGMTKKRKHAFWGGLTCSLIYCIVYALHSCLP